MVFTDWIQALASVKPMLLVQGHVGTLTTYHRAVSGDVCGAACICIAATLSTMLRTVALLHVGDVPVLKFGLKLSRTADVTARHSVIGRVP